MWENWINLNVEPTDAQIKEYFKYVYKGKYYACMKFIISIKLKEKGYTNTKISKLIGLTHPMITYYANKYRWLPKDEFNTISENAYFWIQEGIYPRTKHINFEEDLKIKHRTEIKLTKI